MLARDLQAVGGEVDADDPLGALQTAARNGAEPDHPGAEYHAGRPRSTPAVNIAAPSPVDSPQANRHAASSGASRVDLGERDLRHHRVFGERRGAHEVADRLPVS